MTHDETFGEGISNAFGSGSVWDDTTRKKLEEKEKKEEIKKEVEKVKNN